MEHRIKEAGQYPELEAEYFFRPELKSMDFSNMWLHPGGATSRTASKTMELLQGKIQGAVISKGGDIEWPPRSCDSTPLNFLLWCYVESMVYAN